MMNCYQAHFSADDLIYYNNDKYFGHMPINTNPKEGQFLVKEDNVYEITQVFRITPEGGDAENESSSHRRRELNEVIGNGKNSYWDVYFAPLITQCKHNDVIIVDSNERLYQCQKIHNSCDTSTTKITKFKKITLLSLLTMITDLQKKVSHLSPEGERDEVDVINNSVITDLYNKIDIINQQLQSIVKTW